MNLPFTYHALCHAMHYLALPCLAIANIHTQYTFTDRYHIYIVCEVQVLQNVRDDDDDNMFIICI